MTIARRWMVWAGCVVALAGLLPASQATADVAADMAGDVAAGPSQRPDSGSSSREARRRAVEALPLDRIPETQRKAIEPCLKAATLYRRLPVETIVCDAELLDFALTKPEAIVDIWRVLGISRLSLDPVGPKQWKLSDGYGTVGVLRLVHQERQGRGGLLVFHGRGAYTGPLSPKNLTGSCVLLVRHGPGMPLIVRSAASNLHEICLFMATLSDSVRTNPEGVAHLAGRLPQTTAADRQMLATIARRAAQPAGGGLPPGGRRDQADVAAVDRLQTELASRWLSADELDRIQRQ